MDDRALALWEVTLEGPRKAMHREELIELIRGAFCGVKLGDAISLREADIIDRYAQGESFEEARAQDEKDSWEKIEDDLLEGLQVLAHLDAEGMRYYIPAYMVWTLNNYQRSDSMSTDSTIYTLNPYDPHGREDEGFGLGFSSYRLERYALLSRSQSKAIAEFMVFCGQDDVDGHLDGGQARVALAKHWGQYL